MLYHINRAAPGYRQGYWIGFGLGFSGALLMVFAGILVGVAL